jgi:hypothetical protein
MIRSTNQIVADLLRFIIDGEWSGQTNTSCHCHPEYADSCPECGEERSVGQHRLDCQRMALVKETQAYLRAENELAVARGEEEVYVPE